MGLAGGLFLRQAKDQEPCAVPCDTWASGIRELPVEVIAMPSAQRDLSHSSPRTYTHVQPCRAATFTGVKRTSVRLHICMTSPDLSQHLFFPFQQGFGMVQLCWICCHFKYSEKNPQQELLIGLVLICYHHKGKERTLSCAFAINKPSKLHNKTQARIRRKSSWVEIKSGNGERGTDSILFLFPNMLPLFWDHWLLGLWLSEIFVPFKLRILWKESSRPPSTVYAAFIFSSPSNSLPNCIYSHWPLQVVQNTQKQKYVQWKKREKKKRTPEERGGKKPSSLL